MKTGSDAEDDPARREPGRLCDDGDGRHGLYDLSQVQRRHLSRRHHHTSKRSRKPKRTGSRASSCAIRAAPRRRPCVQRAGEEAPHHRAAWRDPPARPRRPGRSARAGTVSDLVDLSAMCTHYLMKARPEGEPGAGRRLTRPRNTLTKRSPPGALALDECEREATVRTRRWRTTGRWPHLAGERSVTRRCRASTDAPTLGRWRATVRCVDDRQADIVIEAARRTRRRA